MTFTPASIGQRVGAAALDAVGYVVIGVVAILVPTLVANLAGLSDVAALWVLIAAAVVWMLAQVAYALVLARGKGGAGTFGMKVAKIGIVDVEDGAPIGWARAILRAIVQAFGNATVVGLFSPLFDRHRRGWHDKVVACIVIDHRAPQAPAGAAGEAAEDEAAASEAIKPISAVPEFERAAAPDIDAPAELVSDVPASVTGPIEVPSFEPIAPMPVATPEPAKQPVTPVDVGLSEEDMATRIAAPRRPLTATLRWDDGAATVVTSLTVVGRNPSVGDLEGAVAVPIADTTRSLSKTHFAVGFDGGEAYIVDRHSTNGTTIMRPDGSGMSLAAGRRQPIASGDVIVIGDRNFTVEVTS